ncbi:MAG: tetratricopeptide repeat protein [Phycisphaerales bacterium]|nr:MAG: tetratricopeptide repeat protein [Phycisphaerales bacterium]
MKSAIAKSAVAAAVVIAAVVLSVGFWDRSIPSAYAIEQTVEALQNVRFLHLVTHGETGQIEDERWIEIGADGFQVHYRQESPGYDFGVIEDGESTAVYRHEKQAVIIHDRNDMQFQWVGKLGEAFEDLRQNGKVLEEDSTYRGQRAHKVWWPFLSAECYVDPATKLPLAIGDTEMSYEVPPAGTFEIVIPEGYAVLDKRPGAEPGPLPDWLREEEEARARGSDAFGLGTHALANGDFATAAENFELAVQASPRRNWAWFWLGSAYYGLEQYDVAIAKFTKVLEIFKAYGGGGDKPLEYCNYARGLAYAHLGMQAEAEADLVVCLPAMVRTLRIPSSGSMFEYAENPLIRYGEYKPTEAEIVAKMVDRLRLITGQNFGYDPEATAEENEAAIAAWEQWFQTDGQIRVPLEAAL